MKLFFNGNIYFFLIFLFYWYFFFVINFIYLIFTVFKSHYGTCLFNNLINSIIHCSTPILQSIMPVRDTVTSMADLGAFVRQLAAITTYQHPRTASQGHQWGDRDNPFPLSNSPMPVSSLRCTIMVAHIKCIAAKA